MHDDSVLVAIDDATRLPAHCVCGKSLVVTTHEDSIWLECRAFGRPSFLPASVASFLRDLAHDRRFVVDIPAELQPAPAQVARPLTAVRTLSNPA